MTVEDLWPTGELLEHQHCVCLVTHYLAMKIYQQRDHQQPHIRVLPTQEYQWFVPPPPIE